MKTCDYCKKPALITQGNEELCIKHYNLSSDDEEETKIFNRCKTNFLKHLDDKIDNSLDKHIGKKQ